MMMLYYTYNTYKSIELDASKESKDRTIKYYDSISII